MDELSKKYIKNFNEEAFLDANLDVKLAVERGDFPSVGHYLKHFGLRRIEHGKCKFHKLFEPFNEKVYLEEFPEVKIAVLNSEFSSVFDHFCNVGYEVITQKVTVGLDVQINNFIKEYIGFFTEEFCQYNLGVSLMSDEIGLKYKSYFDEHGKYPRISIYFDPDYYLLINSDIENLEIEPLSHFLVNGFKELRNPHPLIDMEFVNNKKIVNNNLCDLIEYINDNSTLSPYFDSKFYYEAYPDIKEAGILAFDHFIMAGANEKRKPNQFFNYDKYKAERGIDNLDGLALVIDFSLYGDYDKVLFSDSFDYGFYLEQVRSVWDGKIAPFKHYITYGLFHNIEARKQVDFDEINEYASPELYNSLSEKISVKKDIDIVLPKLFKIDDNEVFKTIQNLKFTKRHKPDVSIVIPVYNALKELTECLLSIKEYVSGNIEIIIADDKSPDVNVEKAFKGHKGIVYKRNKENLGFLLNVNNAIKSAKGKYVLLLNSDVQLQDDIVKILKKELVEDKSVGIAGPKIVFPNGILQEAGCIIYKNCQTEMVGIGKNAADKAYGFKRYVDYISGACWLFERKLFDIMKGFEESFAPAYAEDLEFCARITKAGKKILYVPETTIMHHLSVSSNSLSSSFKYYQSAVNKAKFNNKYQSFYKKQSKIKPIAFYLPQYHNIKQNSYWWGENYTEWTGAANAKPQFKGHYQPHVPSDLGFYNLTDTKTFENQATLAKRYGVHGFCFYYYNFGDFELMEKSLETFKDSKADINFCLCWANENWTKTWDGLEKNILLEQKGDNDKFFLKVLTDMERFITDSRYIRVDGKPMILIYRESLFTDIKKKIKLWRDYWKSQHNEELYICAVDSMERADGKAIDPATLGFDAAVEFPAHNIETRSVLKDDEKLENHDFEGHLFDYHDVVAEVCTREHPGYKRFPGCFPAWDNTPRRGNKAAVMRNVHPTSFQCFLEEKAKEALLLSGDERMIFINAWNEWGEGTHLEPDIKFGHSSLSAVEKMVKDN